ncbi:retropepsin-like aspartic protease [Psychroserpens sp. SPM9]|uniref:retropepsin-like aspartic protease n=1 Tax=Psychroserpens sp. SPM9 TaxID=2975598 RepID=UPI0021A40DB1|nr:aspartyl protease family protein [Psychroserpens sp. SPM9]MDG5491940.1 retroviral-like aspartic protease family protein [Psychroserpens sp. SPM9]
MKIATLNTFKILIITFSLFACSQNTSLKKGKVVSKNYYEEIAFEFEKNKIIIPVEIDGTTYRFLLDTGAPNIVSLEVLNAINPNVISNMPTNDANGKKQNLKVVELKSVKIGAVEFQGYSALVYDLNGSDIFKCFGIDGFIGSNMLKNSIIQIDAEQRLLKLTDKLKHLNVNKKQSDKIKLVGNQSSPYVWINVSGKDNGRERVLIDTGMGGLYDLSRAHYEAFKTKTIFNVIGQSDGASSVSLFGEVPVNNQIRVHLPKLVVNNLVLENCITHTTKDDNSKIGAELLNHGVMTIDYKHKRFYFEPKTANIDLDKPVLGFTSTLKDNRIVIGYVWDKKLQQQLSYGDAILAINGEPLKEKSLCDFIVKASVFEPLNSIVLNIKKANGDVFDINVTKKELAAILTDFNISLN